MGAMQLTDFDPRRFDVDSIPGLRGAVTSVEITTRRAVALLTLIDRAPDALDDVAELRRSLQTIAKTLDDLARSAGGISEEISGLTDAAQGIDDHSGKLAGSISELVEILPTLRRLTEIVDPLDNTVVRLGRLVDRLPGQGRRVRAVQENPR